MPELKYELETFDPLQISAPCIYSSSVELLSKVAMATSVNTLGSPLRKTSILNGWLYSCKT